MMLSAHRRANLRSSATQACAILLLSSLAVLLTGCGSFFSCEGKASCPTTCTTNCPVTTTDYAYIANSSTGTTYVDGYNVGDEALTAATRAPFSFSYTPSALVVTPANTYLYAATDSALTAGDIYGYSIGTGGALSILASGSPLLNESDAALAVSPDGKWLFCLNAVAQLLNVYSINTSTGVLTYDTFAPIQGATTGVITPAQVTVAPTGDYVAVALGTAGAETFTFDTTTGAITFSTLITPANSATGIYAVAIDANNYLYTAGTAGLEVFSATTAGAVTLQHTYTTGAAPRSIAINPDSTFVYVGNQTDSTITAYSIGTNAALTAVSGSPFTAPTTVSSLGVDSTGAYLVASGYNSSSGINLYAIGATGALTSKATAATGTSVAIPTPIAMTH